MRLKISSLQKLVDRAIDEERATQSLREEVARVLGPCVVIENKSIESIAEAVNERIDVLEHTGRGSRVTFKSDVMARYVDHKNSEVRKLAAKTLPANMLSRFTNDPSSAVRMTVAKRLPINAVSEMLKKFPNDDGIRHVYDQKKLEELKLGVASSISGPETRTVGNIYDDLVDELTARGMYVTSDQKARGAYDAHVRTEDDHRIVASASAMSRQEAELRAMKHAVSKNVSEAGVKQPKTVDEPFDMYGEKRLDKGIKQDSGPELSEQWYKDRANKMMQDYGQNIEYAWENLACKRLVSSIKATSGVDVDEVKLLKAVKDLIKEKEDRALERDSLKETLNFLRKKELIEESTMPVFNEVIDPVKQLLESSASAQDYVDSAKRLFKIQESTVPPGMRMYKLGNSNKQTATLPVVGRLPHGMGFRSIDEHALDVFCEKWNEKQSIKGEPYRISWANHPDEVGKISFTTTLK